MKKGLITGTVWALGMLISLSVYGWTWGAVLPYTQISQMQGIRIEAIPYYPFDGPIVKGITKVYKHNKLLYTLDIYFDEEVRTSDDGSIFVAVRTYQPGNIIHEEYEDGSSRQYIDFKSPMVWMYQNGELVKTYTLKDVVDSAALVRGGEFRNWGYEYDNSAEYRLKKESEYCQDLGQRLAKKFGRYVRCEQVKDSLHFFKEQEQIYDHRVYVENDALYVYTKLATLVSLRLANGVISVSPIDSVQARKEIPHKFIPQKKHRQVLYPDKFAFPKLSDGRPLNEAMASFLGWKVAEDYTTAKFDIYFGGLLIDTKGICRYASVGVYNGTENQNRFPELEERLEKWLLTLHYDTHDIPKGFDAYLFRPILHFE